MEKSLNQSIHAFHLPRLFLIRIKSQPPKPCLFCISPPIPNSQPVDALDRRWRRVLTRIYVPRHWSPAYDTFWRGSEAEAGSPSSDDFVLSSRPATATTLQSIAMPRLARRSGSFWCETESLMRFQFIPSQFHWRPRIFQAEIHRTSID